MRTRRPGSPDSGAAAGDGIYRSIMSFSDESVDAVASVMRLPLLFKGDDFVHTDIVPAYSPAP
ncbi:hypothetical protein BHAOGJBA_5898 [Methylobacterium hispanicum]|jgi:uncharacterized protein with PIN domain|uniref:Uncharacterized protein n=1 Tax=Methylobacterium hispanicum TaxID=270350 RepID=A0AAV4ZUZ3_9HYPH|nr:hypothetical protein BHAOGJBA_5898 [Methylobacterium hispanicum]